MKVLEIGPGSGFTAFRLARRVQKLTLLDITESNIARLRVALKPTRNLRLLRDDVCNPDLARVVCSQFDAIFGLEVFYLLPDPGTCLVKSGCSPATWRALAVAVPQLSPSDNSAEDLLP